MMSMQTPNICYLQLPSILWVSCWCSAYHQPIWSPQGDQYCEEGTLKGVCDKQGNNKGETHKVVGCAEANRDKERASWVAFIHFRSWVWTCPAAVAVSRIKPRQAQQLGQSGDGLWRRTVSCSFLSRGHRFSIPFSLFLLLFLPLLLLFLLFLN